MYASRFERPERVFFWLCLYPVAFTAIYFGFAVAWTIRARRCFSQDPGAIPADGYKSPAHSCGSKTSLVLYSLAWSLSFVSCVAFLVVPSYDRTVLNVVEYEMKEATKAAFPPVGQWTSVKTFSLVSAHLTLPLFLFVDLMLGAVPIALSHMPFSVLVGFVLCAINAIWTTAMGGVKAGKAALGDVVIFPSPGEDNNLSLGLTIVTTILASLCIAVGVGYGFTLVRQGRKGTRWEGKGRRRCAWGRGEKGGEERAR